MNVGLAKRLAGYRQWKWVEGMRALDEDVCPLRVCEDCQRLYEYDVPLSDSWPDLDDPATQGCLFAMLREATDQPKESLGYVSTTVQYESFAPRCQIEVFDGKSSEELEYGAKAFGDVLALALLDAWGIL